MDRSERPGRVCDDALPAPLLAPPNRLMRVHNPHPPTDNKSPLEEIRRSGRALNAGSCILRHVPDIVRANTEADAERKAEADKAFNILSKAELARKRSNALRAIAYERKRDRHQRSLIIRGVMHLAFTLLLAVVMLETGIGGRDNRGVSARTDWRPSREIPQWRRR